MSAANEPGAGWESILNGDPKRSPYFWAAIFLGLLAGAATFVAMQQSASQPIMIAPLMALFAAASIAVGGIRLARANATDNLKRRAIKKIRIYFILGALVTAYYVFMYFQLR